MKLHTLGLALAALFLTGTLSAQVPQLINYQGRVAVGMVNFDGSGSFKFALVSPNGLTTYWSNDGSSTAGAQPTAAVALTVTKGLYSVLLGDTSLAGMTAIPVSVWTNADVRLRVWFNDGSNGFQLLAPDQRIAAVGYAIMAGHAATVTDGSITSAKIAPGAVGNAQLAPNLTLGGTVTATNFSGNGSGLTNLNVAMPPPGMVLIPAGTFLMGNSIASSGLTDPNGIPLGDGDITDAAPVSGTISAFYMDMNLVSWSQWQSVIYWAASNGYNFQFGAGKAANHPVQTVKWYDVVKWCNARSEQAGKPPVYFTNAALTQVYRTGETDAVFANWAAKGYRLPTEAEWEKAARGRLIAQRFPWGDVINQNLANYYGNTGSSSYDAGPNGINPLWSAGNAPHTSPVGSFAANGYGLYDMAGNVFEWCWDWYGQYVGGNDPHGPGAGSRRVFRGGNSYNYAQACRSARRYYEYPGIAGAGFRAVLSASQP